MSENIWYVTTHPGGLEASPEGLVQWVLPGNRPNVTVAPTGRALNLRSAVALLDVLEAEIYEAEPVGPEPHDDAVVLDVRSARLVRRTGWDTRRATMFAIDCAAHVLASSSPAILPDGTELGTVLVDARRAATASDGRGDDRLDYWARVSAMRRIRHDREQLAELSRAIVLADERRDVDALDDAPYASTVAVTDAVLAATEALRHHLLPHVYTDLADRFDDRMELRELDLTTTSATPKIVATPLGPIAEGGPVALPFETAWSAAREAARHARQAAADRGGAQGDADEANWQATALAAYLAD